MLLRLKNKKSKYQNEKYIYWKNCLHVRNFISIKIYILQILAIPFLSMIVISILQNVEKFVIVFHHIFFYHNVLQFFKKKPKKKYNLQKGWKKILTIKQIFKYMTEFIITNSNHKGQKWLIIIMDKLFITIVI